MRSSRRGAGQLSGAVRKAPLREVEKIMPRRTIEPCGINAVAKDDWVEIEVSVDSGSTDTAVPEETLNGIIDITESAACKRGVVYEVADGTQIPKLGA